MTRVETTLEEFTDGFTLHIPEEATCLFPYPEKEFTIKSDAGKDTVCVSMPHSHPHPHIHVTATGWCKKHRSDLKKGYKVVIEVTESKGEKEYRLF